MKKLAVLMMIPALAMFMVPALASANWYYWWGIQGTWEMSASGSCLHSSQSTITTIRGREWLVDRSRWFRSLCRCYRGQRYLEFQA